MRDVFPREMDRKVIEAFLAGTHFQHDDDSTLIMTPNSLRLKYSSAVATVDVLWIAPSDRALYATTPSGLRFPLSILVINHALDLLGIEARIVREPNTGNLPTFEGEEVTFGKNLLLLGPLGLEAYRAKVRRERDVVS